MEKGARITPTLPYIQVQTLVQVDWEPGPTEIIPNWAPHLLRPALVVEAVMNLCDDHQVPFLCK